MERQRKLLVQASFGMEGNGRKRKPFSDLTNARSLSSSSALSPLKRKAKLKHKRSERKSSPSSNIDVVSLRSGSSIGSSAHENPGVREIPKPNPRRDEKQHHKIAGDEDLGGPILLQDYIEKQRAYFAEIDAFELPEEVVSERELE
ncbi:uncharacterized protein LOC113462411 [Phoenix dactylifera]|uniref:Uncharacterized protein LOC113462411 n=1 Tax=Phoenix dactylifera TaxID=42345 RepID=A0A8B8J1D2_PHODC|nr:uncharacterized protein LOC113462411 [Phoenix dactylifera]